MKKRSVKEKKYLFTFSAVQRSWALILIYFMTSQILVMYKDDLVGHILAIAFIIAALYGVFCRYYNKNFLFRNT